MNGIQIFQNTQFGQVRVAEVNNEPMFCLSDVCIVLGLTSKGVNQRLSDEVISSYPITDSLGRIQQALFVNEDGLYDVILDSRKPEAKQFRKWVTSEVLPTIRKHGAYMTQQKVEEALLNPDTLIQLATELKKEREAKQVAEAKVKEQAPKVLFATAVETSSRSCLVGELSKILKQNGVDIGQNRLFEWMRSNGYLCKSGASYNQPTQRAMDMGLFELKQTTISKPDGSILVSTTTKVTGKGQIYFTNKFMSGTATNN